MTLVRTFFILLFICICRADPIGNLCNPGAGSSQISANIGQLLAKLVSTTALTGYNATSVGIGPDQVYGLAQCRGDLSGQDCLNCVQDAAMQIRQRCPNQTDARIWYDHCFLRYSKESFIGKVDTNFGIHIANPDDVPDPRRFYKQLGDLMDKITSQAVVPENEGLGRGNNKLSTFSTLYALVQCTRDLSQLDCAQCLALALENFPNFCNNKKGCQVMSSSCYLRYELYPFFFPLHSDSKNTTRDTSIMAIVHP